MAAPPRGPILPRSDPPDPVSVGGGTLLEDLERGFALHGRDLVTIVDEAGRVEYASPNLERVLGHRPEARRGRPIFELVHEEELPLVRRVYDDLLRTRGSFELVARVRHGDGSWRWFEASGRAYEGADGRGRCLILSRDVTVALQRAHLHRRDMDVLRMLVEGVPPREVLATTVATTAELSPHLSASVLLVHNQGRCLRTAAAAGVPAEHLHEVDGLSTGPGSSPCAMAVRRAESIYIEDIEADPRSAGPFRERARALGLRACWSAPARLPDGTVAGTFTLYSAMPGPPGPVETQLLQSGAGVVGLVVHRQHLERAREFARPSQRLFHDLVRQAHRVLEALPPDHPASAEAHRLVAMTRGLRAQAPALETIEPGAPAPAVGAPGSASAAPAPAPEPAPEPSPATVLVVDDDEAIRSLLSWMLRRAGYEVLTAGEGREALERAAEAAGALGLVVLDWRMPGMGGAETLAALREAWPGLPVLICSGQGDPRPELAPEVRATVDFLAKPFEPHRMVERVGAMFARAVRPSA